MILFVPVFLLTLDRSFATLEVGLAVSAKGENRGRRPMENTVKDAESLVKNITDLPTLPQVITTLMALLDDPQSSIRDINNMMGKDQALVAKILKLVNSAFYAIPSRVSSISQAIAILGFKTVKSIVVSAGVVGMFDSDDGDFSYQEFWVNSLGVATICRFVTTRLSDDPLSGCAAIHPDTAFVAGLLNGIGKVVLNQYAREEFEAIVAAAKSKGISFREAEKGIISGSYADIGYWLAKRWNLSEEIQIPIKFQDRLHECPAERRSLAAIISLSKYLCRIKRFGQSGDFDHPLPPKTAVQILALTKDILPSVTSGLTDEFDKANSFLSMIRT